MSNSSGVSRSSPSGLYGGGLNSTRVFWGKSPLGWGINGFIAPPVLDVNKGASFSDNRFYIREVFNNDIVNKKTFQGVPAKINSPFRLMLNAGDPLSRKNYSNGGTCQTFQSRPNIKGIRSRFGHIQNIPDGTGIQASACNVKYVYDSSDFIKYKKLQAITKTYNQLTNGGNEFHGSQVQQRAIRRY